jgi:hypothetical protein
MPHVTLTLTMDCHTDRSVLHRVAVVPDITFPAGEWRLCHYHRCAPAAGGYTLEVNMAATITMRYS